MGKSLRILDFDLENRPIAYAGNDYTDADITALAGSFIGDSAVSAWLIGERGGVWRMGDYRKMLAGFRKMYDAADIVTGHYIRKHDLPILNWAMVEAGLPELGPKFTHDTYLDCSGGHYLSKSQENLAQLLGVKANKVHMSRQDWREANRLLPEGIEKARRRVVGDVIQHKEVRLKMLERDLLGAPKIWGPR